MLLQAENVSKVYPRSGRGAVKAVENVSLIIEAGSFVALAGHSGSGKTTLLALLGALERPSSGRITLLGLPLDRCWEVELARLRRRVGFVFQNFSLLPRLPLWENVTTPLVPRGWSRSQRRSRAEALLARLGLAAQMYAAPEQLSGGEQQRAALARALSGEPEVLIADEPTSQLDPTAAAQLAGWFGELHAAGMTIVTATHDPLLAALATQRYSLSAGSLRAEACSSPPPAEDRR